VSPIPTLASPLALLLLLAIPPLVWRHHRRAGFGALLTARLPRRTGAAWRLHLPFYARLVALALAVVALARPQLGYAWEEATTEGIDIQLVLDVSGSMAARDFRPDRLGVAKRVLREFVAGRPGDRIGLTVFSGAAVTRAPLTFDRRMLDELIAGVATPLAPDGTAIGVALASAASRLKESVAKARVIVLVTDGANNAGEIDPDSAAALCEGLGLRVYTVGVGRAGTALVPVRIRDPLTGREMTREVEMEVEVDEALLERIAARTGGRFYRATDDDALARVFAEIDRLERTPLAVKRYVRYREGFQPFAWGALLLTALPVLTTLARTTVEP
jgi:Ca-activated chloride channel homolog